MCAGSDCAEGFELEGGCIEVRFRDKEDRAMPVYRGTFLAHALVVDERAAENFELVAGIGDFWALPVALLRLGNMEALLSMTTSRT